MVLYWRMEETKCKHVACTEAYHQQKLGPKKPAGVKGGGGCEVVGGEPMRFKE